MVEEGPSATSGPTCGQRARVRASIGGVRDEQRLRTGTPESRAFAERVRVVMGLTARLNVLPYDDLPGRATLLSEIFGSPVPESLSILPPFYCDYGLRTSFGEQVFVNQGCYFLDLGGITIGDRVMIGPQVTLSTAGHPVELADRYDFLTHAPIRHRGRRLDRCRRDHHAGGDDRARIGRRRGRSRRQGRPSDERRDRHERRRAPAPRALRPTPTTRQARTAERTVAASQAANSGSLHPWSRSSHRGSGELSAHTISAARSGVRSRRNQPFSSQWRT